MIQLDDLIDISSYSKNPLLPNTCHSRPMADSFMADLSKNLPFVAPHALRVS
ncbi:hypothetical protein [Entomobacter blattae]|uniref:hypothetical protein n=1 Tax=Entomobacter blattae TaxID=2762277 RepID=UPI00193B3059|nr:hypothetical protein [Entomobacter blattae]